MSRGDRPFPQSPLMLVVHLALVVLFEFVLLGEILETAVDRHECLVPWGWSWLERLDPAKSEADEGVRQMKDRDR